MHTRVITALLVLVSSQELAAKVKLPDIFSDNMVLQQNSMVAIWGNSTHSKVNVMTSWDKHNYTIRCSQDGSFRLKVKTGKAGGPYWIQFNDGQSTTLHNVLVGEVWVCSGQSNMEMPLAGWGKVLNYEAEIAAASYPRIRLLQVPKAVSYTPLDTIKGGSKGWQQCSPSAVSEFSSVAYFFARSIYQAKHIPVGLIHTSWGGTVAEAWTSAKSLKAMPDFANSLAQLKEHASAATDPAGYDEKLKAYKAMILSRDSGFRGKEPVWAATKLNTRDWKSMKVPGLWEESALPGYDGIVWFRKTINIPAAWAAKELELSLGTIDDDDTTWFNGHEIAHTAGYAEKRNYVIPASLVATGDAVITVRVTDYSGNGGFYGDPIKLTIGPHVGAKLNLAGSWPYKASVSFQSLPPAPSLPNDPNQVTVLYNAMIHPLLGFGIRGVIWYQGESNADRAYQYRTLFPLMIIDWRKAWGIGRFPFLFVQLANYKARKDLPGDSQWAELRDAQLHTLALPGTGMAVAIDIGEAGDIHPKNKQEVGRRLALIARQQVYGEKVTSSGPEYESMTITGRQAVVRFKHADSGLVTHGAQAVQGFALAGEDHRFYWASGEIKGNSVILNAVEVPKPVAVRYGWADNPVCNLYNGAGLPASPFRSDSFTGFTQPKP